MRRNLGIQRLKQSLAGRDRPHGTRARFEQGCRCLLCRVVVAQRVRERKASILAGTYEFNGIVDAKPARKHLCKLSRAGVGIRSVAEITEKNRWKLIEIRAGRIKNVRAATVRAILAVSIDAIADGARVPAGKTRKMLAELIEEGFTQREIAKRLNRKGRFSIRNQKYVFARTEMEVEKLFNQVMLVA